MNVRTLERFQLPLSDGIEILKPELAALKVGNAGDLDIGALCYLRRGHGNVGQALGGRPLDMATLSTVRCQEIRRLIKHISNDLRHRPRRASSLIGSIYCFMRFVDWCDRNNHSTCLSSPPLGKSAFRQYIHNLRERVQRGKLKPNTAKGYQNGALDILSGYFEKDDLHAGIPLLHSDNASVESTVPPEEDSQSKLLALAGSIFNGLADFTLEHRAYPYFLAMPQYLNWPANGIWIFPTHRWFLHPLVTEKERQAFSHPVWAFNYAAGTVEEWDAIAHRFKTKGQATTAVKKAKQLIDEGNLNPQYGRRRDAAILAHNVFLILFVANTGMNWASVRGLSWGKDYEVETSRQGFRSIKYRAAGKLVSFEIQTAFIPTFRKFLSLRNYLLDESREFEFLFMTFGANQNRESKPSQLGKNCFAKTFNFFKRIDDSLPRVMTRQWRAAKADHLLRHYDVSTTSLLLQNSERTVLGHYATGSPVTAMEELSGFFENVARRIESQSNGVFERGALSTCSNYGSPKPEGGTPIEPDCRQPEGCLFCENFRVHPDEVDIRKLLSCKYCITSTAHLCESEEQFSEMFGPVLARIDAVIDSISMLPDMHSMVLRIRQEVEVQGELDQYWQSKIQMLISLELVSHNA